MPKCSCIKCGQHIEFDEPMTGNVVACPSCGKDTTLRIIQDSKKVNHRIEEKSLSPISEDLVNKLVSKIKSFFISLVKGGIFFVLSFLSIFILAGTGYYFFNKETPAETREGFISNVIMCYSVNVMNATHSNERIKLISFNWAENGRDFVVDIANKNDPVKFDEATEYMDKLESVKDIDLEIFNAMKELYLSSLEIWEFSKYPRNIGVRKNYIKKAKEHLGHYRSKKIQIEELCDSRKFKKSKAKEVVDLKKLGDLIENTVEQSFRP